MGKKTKEATAATKKPAKVKVKAPVDPVKTQNLIRLLNILALLLAVAAFLFQLWAVLTHHWKWQKTDIRPLTSPNFHYAQPDVRNDSNLYQTYGLYSRQVQLYSNGDQQVDALASTRFPRLDDGDESLRQCLSQTSTLRGAFLTCSEEVASPSQCHCRRHPYWNAVIFFEIAALVFLGLVVFLTALLSTHLHGILKLAAAGLALLAFLFLLIGLLLILSHLKRETKSFADIFPYIYNRIAYQLGIARYPYRSARDTVLHKAVRRETREGYRMYDITGSRSPYNETHYQAYSEQAKGWILVPYQQQQYVEPAPVSYVPAVPQTWVNPPNVVSSDATKATPPRYNEYENKIGYNDVFEHTNAGIGFSTVLSIIAMIIALLLPLILLFSWLSNKKLTPETKTVTKTTVTTEYVPVPQDIPLETVPLRSIPTEYDPRRHVGDAIVTAHNVPKVSHDGYSVRAEPVIVQDVVIRGDPSTTYTVQHQSFPVTIETTQTINNV